MPDTAPRTSPSTPAPARATGPAPAMQPVGATALETTPDPRQFLSTLPEDVLLSDPRVQGIVGKHAQRLTAAQRRQMEAELSANATRETEARLMKEAEENPFEFSQKWLKGKAEERAKQELGAVHRRAQSDLMRRVGESFANLPEWQSVTPDELSRFSASLAGVPDDDLLPTANRLALELIASKRANQRVRAEMDRALAAEREAVRKQIEAERLKSDDVPDMRSPSGGGDRRAISALSDAEFKQLYERTFPNR